MKFLKKALLGKNGKGEATVSERKPIEMWQLAPVYQEHRSWLFELLASKPYLELTSNSDFLDPSQLKPSRVRFAKLRRTKSLSDVNGLVTRIYPTRLQEDAIAVQFHEAEINFNNKDYRQREKLRTGSYLVPIIRIHEVQKVPDPFGNGSSTVLGQGRYGKCTLVRFREKLCVVKQLSKETTTDLYQSEVKAMCRLNYTDTTSKLYGIIPVQGFHPKDRANLLIEFIGDETSGASFTIEWLLKRSQTYLNEYDWLRLCSVLCRKLLNLHNTIFVHCDIKPNNVVVRPIYVDGTNEISHVVPYFIDLGLAMDPTREQFTVSREGMDKPLFKRMHPYTAPELIESRAMPFSYQSDTYALAVLFTEIGSMKNIQFLNRLGERICTTDFPMRPDLEVIASAIEEEMKRQLLLIAQESTSCMKNDQPIVTLTNSGSSWRWWRAMLLKNRQHKQNSAYKPNRSEMKQNPAN